MEKKIKRALVMAVFTFFAAAAILGCAQASQKKPGWRVETASFRGIPGITPEEIRAVEELRVKYGSFIYGMSPSTEAFTGKDGEIGGFAALFSGWLSQVFGVYFVPALYEWGDLLAGLQSGEVDFTGEIMFSPERRGTFFMSGPVAERSLKVYRLRSGESLDAVRKTRAPRYAFLAGSIMRQDVAAAAGYAFETVYVNSYNAAFEMLQKGAVDAYFGMDSSEDAFYAYGDIVSEDFYPLILYSSCLSTRKAELAPVVSAVDKALKAGAFDYLASLYETGYQEYLGNKLYNLLTEEERAWIRDNPAVPVGAEFNNYPVSFFDEHSGQWDGIYFNTLDEISRLTGLVFKRVTWQDAQYNDLVSMLEAGDALIVPELFRLKEYEGRFLWAEVPLLEDTFAFLSKTNYPGITLKQVPHLSVGVRSGSAYSQRFKEIFPSHARLYEYDTQEEVWNALKHGEVEVIFACQRRLVSYTNYYEETGYKLNLIIDQPFDSSFGYNKNSRVLKSIIDKALGIVNIGNFSSQWMRKTYDYRGKLAKSQRPWIISALVLFFLLFIFVLFFLIKSRNAGIRLDSLVKLRTNELAYKTSQLQIMIDSIPELMFCKDVNLRYTQCNRYFEEYIGIREADIVGKNDGEGAWLPPDKIQAIRDVELAVINEAKIFTFEEEAVVITTGKAGFFETVKAPIKQDGEVVGLIAIIRDITQRKAMEKEFAYQASLLKTIINSLPDCVFCKDLDSKYTLCNKYMAEIFGRELDDILGKDDAYALRLTGETLALVNDTDKKVMSEQQRVLYEEWLPCADGVTRVFETVKAPLMQDDKTVGILGIGRDITARKSLEEELKGASRAKTAFLANMSHEIRTPLNVVIGLTELVLEEENLSRQVTDNLIKINNAGTTLLSIVNDILDFSKIESGKLELNPVEYYTSSLLNDVITLVITRLEEKPITFNLNITDDLPVKLYGDDLRVKQIFTNLLSNAVKYTHRGTIELRVRCALEDGAAWLDVSVSDTGIGIREEDLKKLFSDYNQVDTRANRNIEGTGLGLSITKRLVEMMDGEIIAESKYGEGTTFKLRIKQGFAGGTPIGADIAEKLRNFCYAEDKRIVTKRLVRLDLSYAKVLVVDDMQTNLDVASGILRKYKMQVDCLNSGEEAVDRIIAGNPVYNAIFMDHMMPVMDGIEAADAIRAIDSEYARNIPIIALTANAIHGTEEMFYNHGFQAFISKPIDIIEMDSVIRKWVRSESHEDVPVAESSSPADEDGNVEIIIDGVDAEKGITLYGGEMNIYLPLLRSFAANAPGILDKLRNVTAETLPDYVIAVHGLKGTSAGIGAQALRDAAFNLENKSRAGDLNGVLAQNNNLIIDAEKVIANVKAWLNKYDAVNAKPRLKVPDREVLARLRLNCENYDMGGIDKAIAELESAEYDEGADLVAWIKEKINISEIAEAAARIARYEEELSK